jgi:hypothetical protein
LLLNLSQQNVQQNMRGLLAELRFFVLNPVCFFRAFADAWSEAAWLLLDKVDNRDLLER